MVAHDTWNNTTWDQPAAVNSNSSNNWDTSSHQGGWAASNNDQGAASASSSDRWSTRGQHREDPLSNANQWKKYDNRDQWSNTAESTRDKDKATDCANKADTPVAASTDCQGMNDFPWQAFAS